MKKILIQHFRGTSVTIEEKTTTPPPTTPTTPPSTDGTTGGGGNTGGTTGGGSSNSNPGGNTNTGGTTTNASKNANLKELHLDVEGLSPNFHKNTTTYNIVVPNDKTTININAVPEDSNAKVNITGNTNLKTGQNKITIKVTAPDNKTTKTYIINVTKTDNPDLANANLENLAIENVTLNPEFNENIFEYNAEIGSSKDSLNILAVPKIQGATVNIQGKDNLQFGENIVIITVVARDGVSTKDYIVKVYKKNIEEEQSEINLMSLKPKEELIETEAGKIPVGNILFMGVILIGIGVIIFILIRKYVKENKK